MLNSGGGGGGIAYVKVHREQSKTLFLVVGSMR